MPIHLVQVPTQFLLPRLCQVQTQDKAHAVNAMLLDGSFPNLLQVEYWSWVEPVRAYIARERNGRAFCGVDLGQYLKVVWTGGANLPTSGSSGGRDQTQKSEYCPHYFLLHRMSNGQRLSCALLQFDCPSSPPRRLQARVRVHTRDGGNDRVGELGTALVTSTGPTTLHVEQHHRSEDYEEGTAVPSPRAIGEEEDDHGQGETE